MDGGVAVSQPMQPAEPVGFFHMPKLQIPSYQKSRVYVPLNQLPNANVSQDKQRPASGDASKTVQVSATDLAAAQFDGKRMRKSVVRKTVDYNCAVVNYLENRIWQRDWRDSRAIQPDALYQLEMTPPINMQHKPMNCLTTKFMRQSTNKFRCPIFCISWTPEGRRLVTGASSGEFTLWNGLTFSFETILQAHETSVRAMVWSHNDQWMITADHAGYIKYWQTNMNNVKMYQGHKEPIRDISFCPTDSKFATCSDDGTVRIWDFLKCYEEKILRGHGADVKCVDWHPQKSLIATGSKDNQVPIKLWDPKSGNSLATLHAHKFTVMDLKWNKNGNWLLTAARDHLVKLFDIRNLKEEVQVFKGHKKEATAVAWHPINEQMFASGGSDGAIMFWNAGTEKEVGSMEEAHDAIIWDLAWHPLGHILASASNDHSTKFWTRNRPGDAMRDKYNLNLIAVGPDGELLDIDTDIPLGESKSLLPGMGLEQGLPPEKEEKPKNDAAEELPTIPGLDWSQDAEFFKEQVKVEERAPRKKQPYSRPIPRSFEQAWITNQQPGTLVKDGEGHMKRGRIQSLLSLELPQKPPSGMDYSDQVMDDQHQLSNRDAKHLNRDTDLIGPTERGFNPILHSDGPHSINEMNERFSQNMPLDDQDYTDDQDYCGDQDYRGDQDYQEDQDLRSDEDFHSDMHFRQQDAAGSSFRGRSPAGFKSRPGQGQVHAGQFGVGLLNFRGGSSVFQQGRGPQRGFHGNKLGRFGENDSMELDEYDENFSNGPGNKEARGGMLGTGPPQLVQGNPQGQFYRKDSDMEYDQDNQLDYNSVDHTYGPRPRGGGQFRYIDGGIVGQKNRSRGRVDILQEHGKGNKRLEDKAAHGNWEEEATDVDFSFNNTSNDFDDSLGNQERGFQGNQKVQGYFRGSNNYKGGDRSTKSGRGGGHRGGGWGENRGRGQGRGGRY